MVYADVWLPVPLPTAFTYIVPTAAEQLIQVGMRAVVPFGRNRILTAIVVKIHQQKPSVYEPKEIIDLLDETPSCDATQIQLYTWIASYYMAYVGDVLQAALPTALKIEAESLVCLHPESIYSEDDAAYTPIEHKLLKALEGNKAVKIADLQKRLHIKNIFSIIESLIKKKAILNFLDIREKYVPKKIHWLTLAVLPNEPQYKAWLQTTFQKLEKRPKQVEVLQTFLLALQNAQEQRIPKTEFKKLIDSDAALETLIKHGILVEYSSISSRIHFETENTDPTKTELPQLSTAQKVAIEQIHTFFSQQKNVLLHGITGSGKTEIYIHLIQAYLLKGKSCLVLVPEIMLTTQLIGRFAKYFGNIMGVYHSKYSDNERVEIWKNINNGTLKLIIGVRSSVFLPFKNLGLIVVDEEHDTSYKQQQPAPRYHARDVALYLAQIHHAQCVLGSATPAVESYFLAKKIHKIGYVPLFERYGDASPPMIELVDLKREKREKTLKDNTSSVLYQAIQQNLASKQQTILFQNRRGYAPYLTCEACSHVIQCPACDVSLTIHQNERRLKCHYCGYQQTYSSQCPACQRFQLKPEGFGTERLEEEMQVLFPQASIRRMDQDTTRTKNSIQKIIETIESRQTDILIGTQMVTKGLDFENVTLVGVFDIDRILHFPDFRSEERVYQLLTQVAGRAGRRSETGKVIIQTHQPEHPIFDFITHQEKIEAWYNHMLQDRHRYHYPPYTRLVKIVCKDRDAETLADFAEKIAATIRAYRLKIEVLGPEAPVVSRIQNLYIKEIWIKIERASSNLESIKKQLESIAYTIHSEKAFKSCQVFFDVDPV